MKVTFKQTEDGIQKKLNGLIDRSKTVSSYLNRNLFQQYQKAQIARWQTENESERNRWQPLSLNYSRYKRRKFVNAPGAGNVLMIATGRLSDAATGRNSASFYKKVTDKTFEVGINESAIPYARYPGVLRPYMSFSDETLLKWKQGIRDFIINNKAYS